MNVSTKKFIGFPIQTTARPSPIADLFNGNAIKFYSTVFDEEL
jgi:hypothetical protein